MSRLDITWNHDTKAHPVAASTGISFEDYQRMGTERHRMRQSKTVPAFAQNETMLRRVILVKCWKYAKRGPLPDDMTLAALDADATKKALNCPVGFFNAPISQQEKGARHAEAIKRAGGFAAFVGAIAYRAWRLRWNSMAVAREMGITSVNVRQVLSRLVRVAEELGFPSFETQHHSRGVAKNYKNPMGRDGRMYETFKGPTTNAADTFEVSPLLMQAAALRTEGKTIKEIISALDGRVTTHTLSRYLSRLGVLFPRQALDVERFNTMSKEGLSLAAIAREFGMKKTTLQSKVKVYRHVHGFDSIQTTKPVRGRQPSRINIEQLTALRQDGKTYREIGLVCDLSSSKVAKVVRQHGITAGARISQSRINIEQLTALRQDGKSYPEIAKVFGVSKYAIARAAKRHGVVKPWVKMERAAAMRREGKGNRQIAEELGVTCNNVANLVHSYRKTNGFDSIPRAWAK